MIPIHSAALDQPLLPVRQGPPSVDTFDGRLDAFRRDEKVRCFRWRRGVRFGIPGTRGEARILEACEDANEKTFYLRLLKLAKSSL